MYHYSSAVLFSFYKEKGSLLYVFPLLIPRDDVLDGVS